MLKNYAYNINADIVSNNVIVNSAESSNVRSVGVTLGVCVFVGATLLNFASGDCTGYSNHTQPAYIIYNNQSCGLGNNICLSNAIDLLKIENINKIDKISAFESDWNGNGAEKFSKESIAFFYEVIESLPKQPKIAPTGKGTLLMQYELEDKSLLAFDVGYGRVEKVFVPKTRYDKANVEVFTDDIFANMKRCVEKFYEIG